MSISSERNASGRACEAERPEPVVSNCAYVNWSQFPDYIMMHRHDNLSEVTLIVHGKGQYAVNNHIYSVNVGDVILSGRGVVHDAFMQDRGHYGTLTVQIGNLELPGCEPGQFLKKEQVPVFHLPPQYPELLNRIRSINEIASSGGEDLQERCKGDLNAVLELIVEMTRDSSHPVRTVDTFCLEIEEYINEHYGENLSLETIAEQFYISTFHLSRLFKKETGYNFKQYLMRMRIGEAQKILADTDARIVEVAERVGYEDASYFSRAFQKETGMSPREYRKYISVMEASI